MNSPGNSKPPHHGEDVFQGGTPGAGGLQMQVAPGAGVAPERAGGRGDRHTRECTEARAEGESTPEQTPPDLTDQETNGG